MQIKNIIGALALLAASAVASAQTSRHNLDINVGGGLQTCRMSLSQGDAAPSLGWNLGANYRFMVNQSFGVGAGLGLASYKMKADFDGLHIESNEVHEENGLDYVKNIDFSKWEESQRILAFEVPVALYLLKPINEKMAFKGDLGVKFVMPLSSKYKVDGGEVEVSGYYPSTNITYQDLPQHGFRKFGGFEGDADFKSCATAGFIDAGVQCDMKGHLFYFGAYFSYGFSNLIEASQQPLFDGEHYTGAASSSYADNAHLISAGIKLGLSFGLGGNASGGGSSSSGENNLVLSE